MAKAKKNQVAPAAVAGALAAASAPVAETPAAAPAKAPKAPVVKDEQNGVTRPSTGATRRVWEIADEISAKQKRPAERAEVTEVAEKEGLVKGTIHTQFGRWRKYYGLVTPADERAAKLAKAKADKEAAKAAKAAAKPAAKPAPVPVPAVAAEPADDEQEEDEYENEEETEDAGDE